MSPLLIDPRRLPVIIIGLVCALIFTFYSGYLAGVRSADHSLPQAHLELNVPVTEPGEVSQEAVAPELNVPGANIDVDTADRPSAAVSPVLSKAPVKAESEPAAAAAASPATVPAERESVPVTEPENPASLLPAIVDDAEPGTARYSIQIGIYGSLHNAEAEVSRLQAEKLSAYYETYQNQQAETRYRVRFGYFASRASAMRALAIWQQSHPVSSGYLVAMTR